MKIGKFIAGALLTLALPSSLGWGLQLSDLLTNCRTALIDTAADTNFQRFSNSQLTAFINEGQSDLNDQTWILQNTYTFDISSGTREYVLPADFLTSVQLVQANLKLSQTSQVQLFANATNWSVPISTPTMYFIDNTASTAPYVGFYPMPKFSTYGGEEVMTYVQQPTFLVNLTDYPFNGKAVLFQYHRALTHYCAMRGWETLDRADNAGMFATMYTADVKLMLLNSQRMPDYSPSMHGLSQPGYGQ